MMRHLVKVMLVLEGKYQWGKALRDKRKEQGLLLPLPSVGFGKMRRVMGKSGSGGHDTLCGLMRCLCEAVDKEIMRLVVSFI